jgi:hypothetical protein
VPIPLWIALAGFTVLLVGAASFAAVRAARVWREGRRVGDALAAAVIEVERRAAEVEARAERLRRQAESIDGATSGLQSDLETLNVLVAELSGLGAKVAPIRDVVPTK